MGLALSSLWNYHDDIVTVPATPVAVTVQVPPGFGTSATVTHLRVDDTHGDAYTVWVSQGSPAPVRAQLAALQQAMDPEALEPAQTVAVTGGVVALNFDLPRFGISLITITPVGESDASTLGAPEGGTGTDASLVVDATSSEDVASGDVAPGDASDGSSSGGVRVADGAATEGGSSSSGGVRIPDATTGSEAGGIVERWPVGVGRWFTVHFLVGRRSLAVLAATGPPCLRCPRPWAAGTRLRVPRRVPSRLHVVRSRPAPRGRLDSA